MSSLINYYKLNKRIDNILETNSCGDLKFFNIRPSISKKILNHQYIHLCELIACITKNNIALDSSDPGTGKTYVACALSKQLNLIPYVICPKSMISVWKTVLEYFGITVYNVVNYESIVKGNPWNAIGNNTIIIFDEVHKCKNKNTLNGKLLLSTKELKCKKLLLSATVANNIKDFEIFGYMLGIGKGKGFIKDLLKSDALSCNFNKKNSLHDYLYPSKASRMSIFELGDQFPKNNISIDCYNLDKKYETEVNKAFDIINTTDTKLKASKNSNFILPEITAARIKIERFKIPIILDIIEEYVNLNFSIVIFVNFVETIKELHKILSPTHNVGVLYGEIDINQRTKFIEDFQTNRLNIIICSTSLALGISLHDISGNKPRMSIISPIMSGITYEQILGRIYRVGVKTPVIQKIIYYANTCETVLCNQLKDKIEFLNKIKYENI